MSRTDSPGIPTEELVTVPSSVYDNGERKDIVTSETVAKDDAISPDVVTERLENLGYV
ncbi:hypothetical protein GJR96_17110 [Haloferax sp. MBLA0076]|uniref:Uncharacterized protein n=1 Tax=Haloferax litoreum TaxID=2666140 RepID=A0A6A8GKU6_9EURY|nr:MULTISPECIES: hypothetical protein [Haloferax]MRX23666.1 hypothetical protein [Haloferax litoreum]